MRSGIITRGTTFLYPGTHGNPNKLHLCVTLTEPARAEGRIVLFVPIVTLRSGADTTCVLNVGDHPFIRHASRVDYGRMDQRPEAQLVRMLRDGVLQEREPLARNVLERVLEGVFKSPHAAPFARDFVRRTT